tara:strand:+ start:690 stop:1478 length:789 start_codon:yes stop_codon:yes gene_type:complete
MADYLLFDIETRPNQGLLDNLRHAYEIETNGNVEVQEMDKLTVDKVKKLIENENPSIAWLELHYMREHDGKARKGVFDELDKRLKVLRNPVDKKWFVTPETQEIITIAWSEGPDGKVVVRQYEDENDWLGWISETLEEFWDLAKRTKICGWNSAGFDIPVLMQESRKIGIPYQRYKIHSFSGVEHNMMDLMKVRFPRDWRGLRASAMAVGMPPGEDAVDTLVTGANVAEAYRIGNYGLIAQHCMVDIVRLQYLFRAYEGLYF